MSLIIVSTLFYLQEKLSTIFKATFWGNRIYSGFCRTGVPALSDETKSKVLQAVIQSPKKAIRRLFTLEQDVSRPWCVQTIVQKAKFKHCTPRLIHVFLEGNAYVGFKFPKSCWIN